MSDKALKRLFDLTIASGGGYGTAYEYVVKYNRIKKWTVRNDLKDILIPGLPERYGYSLDFMSVCPTTTRVNVVESNRERLEQARLLGETGLKDRNINFFNQDLRVFAESRGKGKKFDAAFSCEVVQRLSADGAVDYIRLLRRMSKRVFIFVPNSDNQGHSRLTGLKGLTVSELEGMMRAAGADPQSSGYLDIPPWPPGAGISAQTSWRIKKAYLPILKAFGIFSVLENFYPGFICRDFAHLIYSIT